jgi:CheY-like chemotaxis protein
VKEISILIVEDNRLNQIVLMSKLKQWKHQVSIANNGIEALDLMEQQEFDFILMDLMMPVMDGYETTQKIREKGIKIPIVAVSANFESYSITKCMEVGMNDYISKPVDNYQLEKVILKYIEQ